MIIKDVAIDKEVKVKVYTKHNVRFNEIKEVLLNNPLLRKTKDGRYIAINNVGKHLTVIFSCIDGIADIVTAYPSSDWQIKLFKRRQRK